MDETSRQSSSSEQKLLGKKWHGRIICKDDGKFIETRTPFDVENNGDCLINIPELMAFGDQDEKENAIWAKNSINKYRITASDGRRPKEDNGEFGSGYYGSYFPLHPGTFVIVEFLEEDLNSGHITQILSNQGDNHAAEPSDTVPFKFDIADKDDVYLFNRTPRWDNLNVLFEETVSLPFNSHHQYFNIENKKSSPISDRFGGTDPNTLPQTPIRTSLIINSSQLNSTDPEDVENGGIHLGTHDNLYATIDENCFIAINRNTKLNFREDLEVHCRGFGKEVLTSITTDQSINFYQRQHEEEYIPSAGGSLPAKNDNPAATDRLNKHNRITLDADNDIHITDKNKTQSNKFLFDNTLDWVNNKAVKIWFKDTFDFIVNLHTKIHLKDKLDLIINKTTTILIKGTVDFIINKYVKILIKENLDLTVRGTANIHFENSPLEIVADESVKATLRKSFDCVVEKAMKVELRDTMDVITKSPIKTTLQDSVDIIADNGLKFESIDKDANFESHQDFNSYSHKNTKIKSDQNIHQSAKSDFTVITENGNVIIESGQNVVINCPNGNITLVSQNGTSVF